MSGEEIKIVCAAMSSETKWIYSIIGVLVGAAISGCVAYYLSKQTREQNYYMGLMKLMGDHNWGLVREKLSPGISVTNASLGVSVVCYQHINLMFYAWLHKTIVSKDGSLEGWKRWAAAIVDGASKPANSEYASAYRDILGHKDLWPSEFVTWLGEELRMTADKFPKN